MYYSAWDKQCGRYFVTGRNSITIEECEEKIVEHLLKEEKGHPLSGYSFKQIIDLFDVEIIEHEELIEEN